RTMNQIATGKGSGPKAFMLSRRKVAAPDAVWHSDKDADSAPDRPARRPARRVRKPAVKTKARPKKTAAKR
ncbi:MAG: hypothetical protein WAW96_02925, partial [Alphaproteobacteria bacterium]